MDIIDNKVSFPDGQWCLFRDAETVTNRQRRPFMRVVARMRQGEDLQADADYMLDWSIAVTYMLLAEWSWEQAIPKDYIEFCAMFEDLPGPQYDLVTITAVDFMNKDLEATPSEEEVVDVPLPKDPETPTPS